MRGCTYALSLRMGVLSEMPDLNEFVSIEEAAEKFKYHVEHVRKMMREGRIAGLKIGRTWLEKRDALDSILQRIKPVRRPLPQARKSQRLPGQRQLVAAF